MSVAKAHRVGMEVSIAVSHAVQLARAEAIAAYPITPQTHIVEHLSSLVANGELEAEFVTVESEHSAMSASIGAAATGVRTYTATSSQGLALMHEILFIASGMRLPIVMTVANRALSAPLSIWNDHGDIMAEKDIGWIQIFVENGQESFDHSVMAFKIAEDHRVLLPTIINLDGFILTHVVEPLEMVDQETIDKFLPPLVPYLKLDPKKPVTMGAFAMPELYTETKMAHQVALTNSYDHILEVWREWGELTGRHYKPVERYRTEGAKVLLLLMGSLAEVAEAAVDELRDEGLEVGLVKPRLWRPFPFQDIREAVAGAELVIVCDRAMSLGGAAHPVMAEVRSALYPLARPAPGPGLRRGSGRPGRAAPGLQGHGGPRPERNQARTHARILSGGGERLMEKFGFAESQKFDTYASRMLPRDEFFTSGHRACQGCGEALAVRLVCKAIGKDAIIAHATGCMEIVSSGMPQTSWMHPWIHVAFENTSAVASGVEAALKILERKGKLAGRHAQGGGHGGRRRHQRHRPPVSLRGPGAGHQLHLRLLGQRSLHEHRHPALQRHALRGHDHDLAPREAEQGPGHLEEGHDRHCRGPRHSLRGHRLAQLSFRPVLQGAQGPGDPGAGLHQRPVRVPHGLALRHGPERPVGPPGGADRRLSPL